MKKNQFYAQLFFNFEFFMNLLSTSSSVPKKSTFILNESFSITKTAQEMPPNNFWTNKNCSIYNCPVVCFKHCFHFIKNSGLEKSEITPTSNNHGHVPVCIEDLPTHLGVCPDQNPAFVQVRVLLPPSNR